ncbi:hypothetical protein L208DRAFT_1310707 [Tricholoma matsutake]|nr:hypothetical protein L208DRAFT_1310707 [Tricholoma matsutake 945]
MEKASFGLGYHHHDHMIDDAEYAIYKMKKRDILKSWYGWVAIMAGGILWRLSKDVVAPSYMQEGATVGSLGNFHLINDQLSAMEEDIICGVYHIYEQRNQVMQVSWWPKHSTWQKSGMNVRYWTPDCETWYQH